jgi:hypothetical protein
MESLSDVAANGYCKANKAASSAEFNTAEIS